jgi:hypothetical protein
MHLEAFWQRRQAAFPAVLINIHWCLEVSFPRVGWGLKKREGEKIIYTKVQKGKL